MEVWGGNDATQREFEVGGLNCWIDCKPHGEELKGGDLYFVSNCATGRITRLVLADVSGHGSTAAPIAGELRALVRRFVNRLDHGRFVHSLNYHFAESSQLGIFATAVVATYFSQTRRLLLCNAGHPPPLLYRAALGQWSVLSGTTAQSTQSRNNLPLGILQASGYDHFDVALEPGDCVLTYTDGVTESIDEDGEMLGEMGLLSRVCRLSNKLEPHRLISALKREISRNQCDDDVTWMLFHANGRKAPRPFWTGLRIGIRSLLGGVFPPLPDFIPANVLGPIIPSFERGWRSRINTGKQ